MKTWHEANCQNSRLELGFHTNAAHLVEAAKSERQTTNNLLNLCDNMAAAETNLIYGLKDQANKSPKQFTFWFCQKPKVVAQTQIWTEQHALLKLCVCVLCVLPIKFKWLTKAFNMYIYTQICAHIYVRVYTLQSVICVACCVWAILRYCSYAAWRCQAQSAAIVAAHTLSLSLSLRLLQSCNFCALVI